jgi:outer membrane protein assembly factor BamD (BamD/ComL family)
LPQRFVAVLPDRNPQTTPTPSSTATPSPASPTNSEKNTSLGQGKRSEAFRHYLETADQTLGPTDPITLRAALLLAYALEDEGNYADAMPLARRAEQGFKHALGSKHSDSLDAEKFRRRIESELPKK